MGLVAGDTLSGALERALGEAAGSYAIHQGALSAGSNYVISFTPGTLTIEAKPGPAISPDVAGQPLERGVALPSTLPSNGSSRVVLTLSELCRDDKERCITTADGRIR
jgi:hypothetical protein